MNSVRHEVNFSTGPAASEWLQTAIGYFLVATLAGSNLSVAQDATRSSRKRTEHWGCGGCMEELAGVIVTAKRDVAS